MNSVPGVMQFESKLSRVRACVSVGGKDCGMHMCVCRVLMGAYDASCNAVTLCVTHRSESSRISIPAATISATSASCRFGVFGACLLRIH